MNISLIFVTLIGISTIWADEDINATLYDLDGKEKKFTSETHRKATVDTLYSDSSYKNLDGTPVVTEKAEIKMGTLVHYEIQQLQTKERGTIDVVDGKLIFKYYDGTSQKNDKKEKLEPNTLVSSNLLTYLQSHLEEVLKKQNVEFYLAVWYRQETVKFAYSFEKEEGNNVVVRMAPTNMLYRSLVDPIFITVDKTTKNIVSYKGRTTPKEMVNGRYKDFNSLIVYHYKDMEPTPSAPATPPIVPSHKKDNSKKH